MNILIAEDDYTSRLLLYQILKEFGTVKLAVDGREAVEAFRMAIGFKDFFNLVFLDIMMPDLDGQSALKEMRQLENKLYVRAESKAKIIMLTAHADQDNVIRAAQNECDGFLVKPIDKGRLIKTMKDMGLLKDDEADE